MGEAASVRDLLNELRWHPARDPTKARIFYAHRGLREGFAAVRGDEVEEVGSSSFHVGTSTIPFYKVFRITYGEEVLLERAAPSP
ncbi:MAG: RNA repair domain-containing protein [Candidatus Thermoplasmatota archaeon]|nr:RNA repair domain-containing protein [Candidatus Thermoplasmatota archaeon]